MHGPQGVGGKTNAAGSAAGEAWRTAVWKRQIFLIHPKPIEDQDSGVNSQLERRILVTKPFTLLPLGSAFHGCHVAHGRLYDFSKNYKAIRDLKSWASRSPFTRDFSGESKRSMQVRWLVRTVLREVCASAWWQDILVLLARALINDIRSFINGDFVTEQQKKQRQGSKEIKKSIILLKELHELYTICNYLNFSGVVEFASDQTKLHRRSFYGRKEFVQELPQQTCRSSGHTSAIARHWERYNSELAKEEEKQPRHECFWAQQNFNRKCRCATVREAFGWQLEKDLEESDG
nr:2S sulfur-rich seed storage protein 1-like [Ipomoea batatas]